MAATAAVILSGMVAAQAQQVLVCRSLHDDLVNFDRRASTIGTGGAHSPDTSVNAILNLPDAASASSCSPLALASSNCHPDHPDLPQHPLAVQVLADPVRLRLIELMRRYHCEPLEVYASSPFDAQETIVETDTTVRARY